jgi:hypothetical protein
MTTRRDFVQRVAAVCGSAAVPAPAAAVDENLDLDRKSAEIITHEQLAAQHFEPDDTYEELREKDEELLRDAALAVRFALGVLRKTKPELIEAMKKMDGDDRLEPDAPERLLGTFTRGREIAECFQRLIDGAECRTAVAIANIRPEAD